MENTGPCSQILMIRPANPETAGDNSFQKEPVDCSSVHYTALCEFDAFVDLLVVNGIEVTLVEDTSNPLTIDSIFPNNWISTHANGTICLFTMLAKSRRMERKPSVLETLDRKFQIQKTVDLTEFEARDKFLEGTGSMVLDRENGIIYASRSYRTQDDIVREFAFRLGFPKFVIFESRDEANKIIYDTNVMMCVADGFVIICLDSISNPLEREHVKSVIEATGKKIVQISIAQVNNLAGNMLQVQNTVGEKLLVMSSRAYKSLNDEQRQLLQKFNDRLVHSNLTTIEDNGGGSARSMMAEIYLTKK